jgi:DNA-3-methyladenine glycosylase II
VAPDQTALRRLRRADPELRPALRRAKPFTRPARPDLYGDLIESILSQQLSIQAAATIHRRLLALFPGGRPSPDRLVRMPLARLRAAGVSRQKAGYLKNVARFALRNDLSARALRRLDDEAVIARLTSIKGVGRWTVEMLLMFTLNRPDVFPADDVGIQNAMKRLYNLRGTGRPLRRRLERIAEAWRPHRTLACRCLWAWRRDP